MTLEISEQEMISRYVDSLKRAASRAVEFIRAEESAKPALFVDFLHQIKVAAGSAHQLGITQENTHFLVLRDKLEMIIEVGQTLPTFGPKQNGLWMSIKNSLEQMAQTGFRLATSKGMKRTEVLANLNLRQLELSNKIG